MFVTLAVSHNIYLTKEERYSLAQGQTIEVIGVSVPVWFHKGNTSEPANEIFCKYILTNEEDYPVTDFSQGYKINIPQVIGGKIYERPDLKRWNSMSMAEQEKWSKNHPMQPCVVDLLDLEDGGLESLRFKRYAKIKDGNKKMNAIHTIEIASMESLVKSLV